MESISPRKDSQLTTLLMSLVITVFPLVAHVNVASASRGQPAYNEAQTTLLSHMTVVMTDLKAAKDRPLPLAAEARFLDVMNRLGFSLEHHWGPMGFSHWYSLVISNNPFGEANGTVEKIPTASKVQSWKYFLPKLVKADYVALYGENKAAFKAWEASIEKAKAANKKTFSVQLHSGRITTANEYKRKRKDLMKELNAHPPICAMDTPKCKTLKYYAMLTLSERVQLRHALLAHPVWQRAPKPLTLPKCYSSGIVTAGEDGTWKQFKAKPSDNKPEQGAINQHVQGKTYCQWVWANKTIAPWYFNSDIDLETWDRPSSWHESPWVPFCDAKGKLFYRDEAKRISRWPDDPKLTLPKGWAATCFTTVQEPRERHPLQ